MASAVIYKSKYGSAERYAKWLAEDLGADLFRAEEIDATKLSDYDVVIYCGSVYAGMIRGFKFIKKHFDCFDSRRLIVVAVGATGQNDESIEMTKVNNFTSAMKRSDNIDVFLLRGSLDYDKMGFFDRLLTKMAFSEGNRKKANREKTEPTDTKVKFTYGMKLDLTDRRNIAPIVTRAKEIEAETK